MTVEAKVEDIVEQDEVLEGTEDNEVQSDPHEERARQGGWMDEAAWVESGRDPADWRPAREYNDRGELIARVKQLDGAVSRYKEKQAQIDLAIEKMAASHAKALKAEREQVLRTLKAQKVEALRNDEHEAVVEIDERIQAVKAQEAEDQEAESALDTTTPPKQQGVDPVAVAWASDPKNSWYKTNPVMQAFADRVYDTHKFVKNLDTKDSLAAVEAEMRKHFPKEFGVKTPGKGKVSDTGDGERPGPKKGTKGKYNVNHLDDTARKMGRELVKQEAYPNMQAYVDSLAEDGYFN